MRTSENGAERPPRGSSALRDLVTEYKGQMALLATVSFIGALLEALFLVILTGVAMAMVSGESSVGPYLGRSLSINVALLVAAAVLLVRLALNLSGVRISAGLTADVTKDQRRLLSHAYLTTSWATQAGEPAGRLQELLTSFVARVSNAVSTLTNAITAALSLTAFVVTGLVVDAASTAAVLVALALVGAVLRPLRQRIRRRAGASAQANLEFANAVSELGSLGLEMQTFGVQSPFAARIDDLTDRDDGHPATRADPEWRPPAHLHVARLRSGSCGRRRPCPGRVRRPRGDRCRHPAHAAVPQLWPTTGGRVGLAGHLGPLPRPGERDRRPISHVSSRCRAGHP
jgi:ATP-binding cassette subfamily B protein